MKLNEAIRLKPGNEVRVKASGRVLLVTGVRRDGGTERPVCVVSGLLDRNTPAAYDHTELRVGGVK